MGRQRAQRRVVLVAALWPLLIGCGETPKDGPSQAPRETDPERARVVAKVGAREITVGELSDAINKQNPYIRLRYTSLERKKEFLKNMVRMEVLAAEADKRKLERDPEVLRRVRRVMVDRLMEKLHEELVSFDSITEADAKAYYDQHAEQYKQPQKVRVSLVLVKTKAEADKVLAEANKKPGDLRHFAQLVTQYSIDPASKVRRGDLGFFDAKSGAHPPELVAAAFGIGAMWKLAGPVKTDKGFAVLLKTGERPQIDRPFALEKDRIRNRLFNERRYKAVNTLIEKLQKQAKVEVLEQNLARVKIDKTQPKNGRGPGAHGPAGGPAAHGPGGHQH